ncbi:6565_t:CDS:2 [Scutellospora calospora]|uniref:6565_t:CDS:1 n=1 Tax=Scutellospora calospora TaxID=85575 RepID=A0ACA9JWQ0_9GLOM|nr:6565_t:CDS:2 [Scutellospora calospora]
MSSYEFNICFGYCVIAKFCWKDQALSIRRFCQALHLAACLETPSFFASKPKVLGVFVPTSMGIAMSTHNVLCRAKAL